MLGLAIRSSLFSVVVIVSADRRGPTDRTRALSELGRSVDRGLLARGSSLVSGRTAQYPTGTTACPCINPFTDTAGDGSGLVLGANAAISGDASCSITRNSDNHCFPASYGTDGCKKHDLEGAPECVNLSLEEKPECEHCALRQLLPSHIVPSGQGGVSSLLLLQGQL